jgi:tetratricopeptide (TPR) repeat protein
VRVHDQAYSEATFLKYLALARAMRDFTADAAKVFAQARRSVVEAATTPGGKEAPVAPAMSDEAPRHYRLGLRRLADGDYDGAATAFSRATALNALYVEAHLGLAEAWRAKGDERRYREAMKRAAEACARARRFEELRDRFVDLLKKDRQGFNPFFALGNESQRARDYAGAVIAYREALALPPDKGDIYNELARPITSCAAGTWRSRP